MNENWWKAHNSYFPRILEVPILMDNLVFEMCFSQKLCKDTGETRTLKLVILSNGCTYCDNEKYVPDFSIIYLIVYVKPMMIW